MTVYRPSQRAFIDPRQPRNHHGRAMMSAPRQIPSPRYAPTQPSRADTDLGPSSFVRFCLIGALGFVVDAGALFGLIERFDVAPLPARVISILIAITVTWALHRRWTFRSDDPERLAEWSRFLAVSLGGGAINYAVYAALLLTLPGTPPLLALTMGSGVALIANYAGARMWAFRRPRAVHF